MKSIVNGAKRLFQKEKQLQELNSKETETKAEGEKPSAPNIHAVKEEPGPNPEADLRQIVDESKEKLAAEEEVPIKKRGRPKGSKQKAKTDDVQGATQPPPGAMPTPQMVEYISGGIQFLGATAAQNTGYDGFYFPKPEADHLGGLADKCMERYFPNMSDGAALIGITVFSFGMAIGGRYLGYQQWLKKHKTKENDKNTEKSEETTQNPVGADAFFTEKH